MKGSWKSTLFGIIGACWGVGEGVVHQMATNQPIDWKTTIFGLIVGGLGYVSKDFNVTGAPPSN